MIRSKVRWFWAVCWCMSLAAQTQVDLKTQSKSVDFQSAASTKPFKSGSSLPVSCTQGEMFFLTSATPGSNVYGCPNGNWVLEGGAGGGGGGLTTIKNSGTTVGSRSILDLSTGPGVVLATSDSGQSILIQTSLDTSVTETRNSEQAGASLLCASASGSGTAYTCFLTPTVSAYTTGMLLHWKPDTNAAGGATTLSVDSLGAAAVRLSDGTTNPSAGEIIAGRMYEIWYDGSGFRLLNPSIPPGALGEAQPACAAGVRGRLWFVAGAAGVKDALSVCAKDASNAYAWRSLY